MILLSEASQSQKPKAECFLYHFMRRDTEDQRHSVFSEDFHLAGQSPVSFQTFLFEDSARARTRTSVLVCLQVCTCVGRGVHTPEDMGCRAGSVLLESGKCQNSWVSLEVKLLSRSPVDTWVITHA